MVWFGFNVRLSGGGVSFRHHNKCYLSQRLLVVGGWGIPLSIFPMVFREASLVQEMKRMKDALPSGLRIGKERGTEEAPLILTQDWKRCRMSLLLLLSEEWNGFSFPTFPKMERMDDDLLLWFQE